MHGPATSDRRLCEHMFVRWSNLTLEDEEQRRLPGYRDEAVVRRFDAPEALETRFYEVRARSVLNRVPERSRMPFRWTINPYRGCSHACTYCIGGDSTVLMADGRTRAMRDLRVGDWIYGTEQRGSYRRFVPTQVLDKWSSVKPAIRSHDRGWHRADRERRPPLSHGTRLEARDRGGMWAFAATPSNAGSSPARSGRVRCGPHARRRLQARVPMRIDSGRRQSRLVFVRSAARAEQDRGAIPISARPCRS